jgi:ribosomal protein RSM22 (predicted rRNA methylase)
MELTLSSLYPHLIYEFKNERELVAAIEEISLKFTKERESISDYLQDPKLVSAYTAFYLLTNVPKLGAVMKWLPQSWIDKLFESDFIDLGAGSGTFSLAFKALGGKGNFYQIEKSPYMRAQAKKLWEAHYSYRLFQGERWEWKNDRERFVLFGHSANEMDQETILFYIDAIKPHHLLFIEPGTKDFFKKMLPIREKLFERGFHNLYPCPQEKTCPLQDSKDWCHQFIEIKHNSEVERLSQLVRKDRKLMPLTVQAFSHSFVAELPSERIIRVLPETKFSHEWEVCHDNVLEHYQIMKRDLSKSESKLIGSLLAGEAVMTSVVKEMENSKRVKFEKIIKN